MAEQPANIDSEIWKDIPGWDGFYQASSNGRIRSLDRYIDRSCGRRMTVRGQVMSTQVNPKGYLVIRLRKPGVATQCLVHRLVCSAFHGAPPTDKHQAAHNNGMKDDCSADNVRWATAIENCADRKAHGTENSRSKKHKMYKFGPDVIEKASKLISNGMSKKATCRATGMSWGALAYACRKGQVR